MLTLDNLVAHALQVVCLAALGTATAAAVRIDSAAVRYAYWRALLAAALVLPWIQPLRLATAPADSRAAVSVSMQTAADSVVAQLPATAASGIDWFTVALSLLLTGAAARLAWSAVGLLSLRRLRGLGTSATDEEVAELQATLCTRADVRYVEGLKQPATFGLRHPVVLVPDCARQQPAAIRRALLCHELLHVQRRDWLWVACEEVLLAAFWFNPAMWWIVAQIRRSREEAVDELTVLVTGARRAYVKALLAFAEDVPLAPAPAFARRRHLVRRITLIASEAAMSSKRIVLSCAVMALILVAGGSYAIAAFPMTGGAEPQVMRNEPGPLELRAMPASAQNPVPRRTDYEPASYPLEARVIGASGSVTIRATLDEVGRIAETRLTGFSLRTANPAAEASFSNISPRTWSSIEESFSIQYGEAGAKALMDAVGGMALSAANAMRSWRFEPPAAGPVSFDVAINFKPDGETTAAQGTGVRGTFVGGSLSTEGALRVGGGIKTPTKIKDVRPIYPAEARIARVTGMVIIEARIGADGSVEDARVLRSIPLLDQAALDAVRQWQFTPTLLNGVPTPVIMTVTVNFTLQ